MRGSPRIAIRGLFGVVLGAVVVCAVPLGGCTERETVEENERDETGPVVQTAERGPVKMTVTVNNGRITLAERLKLTVEVAAEEGVDVEMPHFGERMTDFAIRDFREELATAVEGGRRWRQMYDLDVFLSGDYTIPEMTAMFTDRRGAEDSVVEAGVTTDEFTVTVTSLLEGEFDPKDFRDIKGPVPLPVDRTWAWAWWTAGGVAGMAVLVGATVWLIHRLRLQPPEVIIPAHEWAFDQLKMLIDDELVERGMVHEFYFRLSMIVRQYIERRFELTAPEWTTEEFLAEVQRSLKLPVEYRGMLGNFLTACDMVKFALYEPAAEEIEKAFNAARDFVDRSAEGESQREMAA
ncbi:MAG: hypothetical protein V3W34_08155 [Phycisphaerae bacterium]